MKIDKLQHPFFILSIALLLLNDFFLKQVFGNNLTGKLSDFAGLFAYPFFFSCLFPQQKKLVHILTAIIFVWWKSSFSQVFIDWANILIPINRVIDFSDNIALLSIVGSYFTFERSKWKVLKYRPVFVWTIILTSCFSFMATSVRRLPLQRVDIDRTYLFDMNAKELITKLNTICEKAFHERDIIPRQEVFNSEEPDSTKYIYAEYLGTVVTFLNPDIMDKQDSLYVRSKTIEFVIIQTSDSTTEINLSACLISSRRNPQKEKSMMFFLFGKNVIQPLYEMK